MIRQQIASKYRDLLNKAAVAEVGVWDALFDVAENRKEAVEVAHKAARHTAAQPCTATKREEIEKGAM